MWVACVGRLWVACVGRLCGSPVWVDASPVWVACVLQATLWKDGHLNAKVVAQTAQFIAKEAVVMSIC